MWGAMFFISLFLCVIPFTLYAYAGQLIPSSLSSIYNASTPVVTMLVGLAVLPDERLTKGRLVGLLVAALGVVILAAPWAIDLSSVDGTSVFLAQLACLGANVCYAIAYTLTRKLLRTTRVEPTVLAAGQITAAASLGILVGPFIGAFAPVDVTPERLGSLLALGILVLSEALHWYEPVGGVLILTGVLVSQRRR